jgi:hypothetical protein
LKCRNKFNISAGVPECVEQVKEVVMRTTIMVLVSLGLAVLSGCGSPSDIGSSGEGRTRLSLNDSSGEFGDYVIHINGMASTALAPFIAEHYGIVRSEERGVVNLVILKKTDVAGVNKPVKGTVEVSAANLTGQLKSVELTEVIDDESIYYLSQVSIDDREMINFDFDVRPEDSTRVLRVRFTHQFYEE